MYWEGTICKILAANSFIVSGFPTMLLTAAATSKNYVFKVSWPGRFSFGIISKSLIAASNSLLFTVLRIAPSYVQRGTETGASGYCNTTSIWIPDLYWHECATRIPRMSLWNANSCFSTFLRDNLPGCIFPRLELVSFQCAEEHFKRFHCLNAVILKGQQTFTDCVVYWASGY